MKKKNREGKKKANSEGKATLPVQRTEVFPRWAEEFEKMREDFFRWPFSEFWQPLRKMRASGFPTLSMPVVDLFEEKDTVVVKAEMPGLEKKDIEVNLTDSRLTIKGEKKKEEEVKEKDYFYSERSYGSFARVLQLPCQVKGDKVKASFNNGVLEVKLPKSEETKSRSVAVKID